MPHARYSERSNERRERNRPLSTRSPMSFMENSQARLARLQEGERIRLLRAAGHIVSKPIDLPKSSPAVKRRQFHEIPPRGSNACVNKPWHCKRCNRTHSESQVVCTG